MPWQSINPIRPMSRCSMRNRWPNGCSPISEFCRSVRLLYWRCCFWFHGVNGTLRLSGPRLSGILMGWVVLFSDSSEKHTYIIALAGFMLWYWSRPVRTRTDKALFWGNFVLLGLVPIDLICPVPVMRFITQTLWLHVWFFCFTWSRMVWLTFFCPVAESPDSFAAGAETVDRRVRLDPAIRSISFVLVTIRTLILFLIWPVRWRNCVVFILTNGCI